ncbi:hypothetical protein DFH08DRAFT_965840 [Mycena albidolilacea]|uniref:F-box domain-containing protein n=1 Tax=Mycena albidolilacea TaxID=1033008 RepID=A0AAD7EK65_9AGAR|nr:hypothetical protein DFH08DRAFT_965840 [Mycena albidolilacea]
MSFAALADEILLKILSLCDVYTVLAISAINKRLRCITFDKQLWLILLRDDTFRETLELHPLGHKELENHSTEELVGLVKCAVAGPPRWWLAGPSSYSQPAHRIGFGVDLERYQDPCLLPGTRYMMLRGRVGDGLYMYEVRTSRRVWEYDANFFTTWAVDLAPGSPTARVVLLERSPDRTAYNISVEEINLAEGVSREVFFLEFGTKSRSLSTIVGDFLLLPPTRIIGAKAKLLLVNWRSSTYVPLDYGTSVNSTVELISGYLVVTYPDRMPPYQQHLSVINLDAFSQHMRPLTAASLSDEIPHSPVPIAADETLEYNGRPVGDFTVLVKLSALASALHRGAYNIVVYAGEIPQQPSLVAQMGHLLTEGRLPPAAVARPALLSFKFTPPLSPGRPCGLRLVSALRAAPGFGTARLSPRGALLRRALGSVVVSYYQ